MDELKARSRNELGVARDTHFYSRAEVQAWAGELAKRLDERHYCSDDCETCLAVAKVKLELERVAKVGEGIGADCNCLRVTEQPSPAAQTNKRVAGGK